MRVRRITPNDEGAYRSILARTSVEDRYFRFFTAIAALDPADIRRAVEDRADMIGFIAEENGRSLGIAHGALLEGGGAELTLVVAEDARRRGVGSALLKATIAHLRKLGIDHVVAYSLSENIAFSRLARSLGLRVERASGAELFWVLEAAAIPSTLRAR